MNEHLFVESKVSLWTLKGFWVPEDAVFMKKISPCRQTVSPHAVPRYNTSAYLSLKQHGEPSHAKAFIQKLRDSYSFCTRCSSFVPISCIVCFWRDNLQWARASSFTRFLDHTQRRSIVGRTSTRQHTTLTKDRHPCPRWDSNPQSQQASGRRPTP